MTSLQPACKAVARLRVAAHRANDVRPQACGPLTKEPPNAACGGVHQIALVLLHSSVHFEQQHPYRESSHERRGSGAIVDVAWQRKEPVCRDQPLLRIGAVRRRNVGDPVALAADVHARADRLNHSDGVEARNPRELQSLVETAANVNVMEVDADRCVPQPHLVRSGRPHLDGFEAQLLHSAVFTEHDTHRHSVTSPWMRRRLRKRLDDRNQAHSLLCRVVHGEPHP